MNKSDWIVITLAFIVGLLTTGFFYFDTLKPSWFDLIIIAIGLGIIVIVSSFVISKYLKITKKTWLIAYLIAFIAVIYFQFRIPSPQVNDISYQITPEKSQLVLVTGKVIKEPRLSSNQKLKFWLQAEEISLLEKRNCNQGRKSIR